MINWQDVTTWRVLVVDDEPDNLEVVAETLEYKGATVQTAINGEEALKILGDFSANLILTDLSMPVMDGWKMRFQLQHNENFKHIPVIALSAHAIAGDQQRALEAGFNGYLTKPVSILTLLDDIRSAYIEPVAENTPEAKAEDTLEAKVEDTLEAKAEDTLEAKVEDTLEAKVEDTLEAKVEDTLEAKADVVAENKTEAKAEDKTEEKTQ